MVGGDTGNGIVVHTLRRTNGIRQADGSELSRSDVHLVAGGTIELEVGSTPPSLTLVIAVACGVAAALAANLVPCIVHRTALRTYEADGDAATLVDIDGRGGKFLPDIILRHIETSGEVVVVGSEHRRDSRLVATGDVGMLVAGTIVLGHGLARERIESVWQIGDFLLNLHSLAVAFGCIDVRPPCIPEGGAEVGLCTLVAPSIGTTLHRPLVSSGQLALKHNTRLEGRGDIVVDGLRELVAQFNDLCGSSSGSNLIHSFSKGCSS